MLISKKQREDLHSLFIKLKITDKSGKDKDAKIEQIIAYLEVLEANIKHFSRKRCLYIVEACAGNCYLSFLISYYYTHINKRSVQIYCIEQNAQLMENASRRALELEVYNMVFVTSNVLHFKAAFVPDAVLSLHACDLATDATLYIGIKSRARLILSVSCCQHTLKRQLRNSRYRAITRHGIFKDRMVYMVGDSIRALLLEMKGYTTDIFEFVSSRYTDKNVIMRARYGNAGNKAELGKELVNLCHEFRIEPVLQKYLEDFDQHTLPQKEVKCYQARSLVR